MTARTRTFLSLLDPADEPQQPSDDEIVGKLRLTWGV